VKVVATFAEARAHSAGVVGLVPTMGYLHDGHRSLLDRGRDSADTLQVSIFVNPLQFNDPADLDRYPRDLDRDLAMCEQARADVVFVPEMEEMYPAPSRLRVTVADVTETMEGPRRPGHFEGVATVVAKLFAGLRPDRAFFGRKDGQQVAVVRAMVRDLRFPVEIVACPTVREPGGLAMSSRNVFLSPDERRRALGLSAGLMAAADAVERGERAAGRLEAIARSHLAEVEVEYVELAGQEDAHLLDTLDRPAFLAVAALVGRTRLIDNVAFDWVEGVPFPDRGIEEPA
jgi:pantoate--beta-alanine ligase